MTSISRLKADQMEEWDRFVADSPQGSVFCQSAYLHALQRPFKIYVMRKNGHIVAGLPVVRNEIGFASNPVFCKYLGLLLKPNQPEAKPYRQVSDEIKIAEEFVNYLAADEIGTFSYTFNPAFENWLGFYRHGFRQETRYTYRIDGPITEDNLAARIQPKVRTAYRKAVEHGVTVSSSVDLDSIYELIRQTFLAQGAEPPFKKDWFMGFIERLENSNLFQRYGAFDKTGKCVAVAGLVADRRYSYLIINGSNMDAKRINANTKLIFDTIIRSQQAAAGFDFEGSMIKEVEAFYRSFNGTLSPYFSIWNPSWKNFIFHGATKVYKKMKYRRNQAQQ